MVSCAFDALTRSGGGSGGLVTITAESDRFLTHMMRMIAGTLVQVCLTSQAAANRGRGLNGRDGRRWGWASSGSTT